MRIISRSLWTTFSLVLTVSLLATQSAHAEVPDPPPGGYNWILVKKSEKWYPIPGRDRWCVTTIMRASEDSTHQRIKRIADCNFTPAGLYIETYAERGGTDLDGTGVFKDCGTTSHCTYAKTYYDPSGTQTFSVGLRAHIASVDGNGASPWILGRFDT